MFKRAEKHDLNPKKEAKLAPNSETVKADIFTIKKRKIHELESSQPPIQPAPTLVQSARKVKRSKIIKGGKAEKTAQPPRVEENLSRQTLTEITR